MHALQVLSGRCSPRSWSSGRIPVCAAGDFLPAMDCQKEHGSFGKENPVLRVEVRTALLAVLSPTAEWRAQVVPPQALDATMTIPRLALPV